MCLPFKDSVCFTLLCVWPFPVISTTTLNVACLRAFDKLWVQWLGMIWINSSLANWNNWTDWSLTPTSLTKRMLLDHNNNPFYSIVTWLVSAFTHVLSWSFWWSSSVQNHPLVSISCSGPEILPDQVPNMWLPAMWEGLVRSHGCQWEEGDLV